MPGSVHIELLALVQNSINRLSAHDVLITQARVYVLRLCTHSKGQDDCLKGLVCSVHNSPSLVASYIYYHRLFRQDRLSFLRFTVLICRRPLF